MPTDPGSLFRRMLARAVQSFSGEMRVEAGFRPARRLPMPLLGASEGAEAGDDTQFSAGYDTVCGITILAFIVDFSIVPFDLGTAQAGAPTTITLRVGASAVDDAYNDQEIILYSGMGCGQTRILTDYVGATKLGTVDHAWDVIPDNTSLYAIGGDDRVLGP